MAEELLLRHRIKPENALYIQEGHSLLISAYTTQSSLIVGFTGQYLDRNQKLSQFHRQLAPASDSVAVTSAFELGECFLLNALAYIVSGTATYGQAYCSMRIQQGAGSAATPIAQVFQGWVDNNFNPTFPGPVHLVDNAQTGSATSETLTLTTGSAPAAGADWTQTVTANQTWRLISVYASLACSGSAANREPRLIFNDGTNNFAVIQPAFTSVAGFTDQYTWVIGVGSTSVQYTDGPTTGMGSPILKAGYIIKTSTVNIQAGDQWSAPKFFYGQT